MKKEDVSGIIAYILIMAIAIIFGFTVLRNHGVDSGLSSWGYIGFVFLSIIVGVVFNAILFELAHVVGAKIGGYMIISVNILGICFDKKDGKLRIHFASFDGLTGETKIFPKKGNKPCNPSPYLLFGSVFFALEALIIVPVFIAFKDPKTSGTLLSNLSFFLLTVLMIGGMIWLYNILPFQLDTMTDGYRLRMVTNPKNKEAFNELLRVEREIEEGNKNVEVKVFTDITNFTADLNLNKVYVLLDKKEYNEAEKLLDIILTGEKDLSPKTYLRAQAQKIYINIFTKSIEEAKKYYDEKVPTSIRRELSKDISMPSIRTYLLMSSLLDKSRSESYIALNNVDKAFKMTPTKRKEIEASLFNDALAKAIEAHPDWEMEDYKIEIEKKTEEKSKTKSKKKKEEKEE